MNLRNCNYITCYRKKDEYIYIYLKNGVKYKCKIIKSNITGRYFLSYLGGCNDYLFTKLNINKYELISRLPGKYFDGNWPESKTKEEVYILLRELIKESKKEYALKTEL